MDSRGSQQLTTLDALRVKIFADGAERSRVEAMCAEPWIRGFTTNPTLMRQAGVTDYESFARELLELVPDRPISFEVIRNALVAATDEMVLALKRSAYSTNIKTRYDFSCAFFDARLRPIAQGFAQPVHLGSMVEQIPQAVRRFGPERLGPGDMVITNDPYPSGVHLNDVSLVAPVHDDGELLGYVAVLSDITQERAAQLAIVAAQQDLRRVIEGSPEGIAVVRDERWIFVNRALVQTLGYGRAEELLGSSVGDILHPEDRASFRAEILDQDAPCDARRQGVSELRCRAANGEYLAFVKDRFGFKPLVMAETDDFVAIATEEVALRQALGPNFVAREPAPGTMQVWSLKGGVRVAAANR